MRKRCDIGFSAARESSENTASIRNLEALAKFTALPKLNSW